MCLYTPQALQAPKKKSKGSSSYGTKISSRGSSTNRGRSTLPRNLIINQPMPVPPPQVIYPSLPRVEILGEGERTNVYFPPSPPAQSGQTQNQGGNQSLQNNGQRQNNNGERRRSSMLVQEVDRAVAIAKRLGEAVRRGSASSFGRGRDYETRRDFEHERERLQELDKERARELDLLGRGRAREREKERDRSLERRVERQRRNRRRYRQDSSSSESRSRSRERRSQSV